MIDPATVWIDIKEISTKRANVVANVLEKTWLTRYPRPSVITLDRGKEFMAEVKKMIRNDYGIKKRPITVKNLQANSILERVHQMILNILRTFKIHDMEWTFGCNDVCHKNNGTYHHPTHTNAVSVWL